MTGRTNAKKATSSWDAFWASQFGGQTEVIRDVEVKVPTDIPLAMRARAQQLQDSEDEQHIRELLALLFGADVLDQWTENGMGLRELKTVLAWGSGQGSGAGTTFEEALEMVLADEAAEAAEGKAPSGQNRATRRATAKKTAASARSGSTGGRSKPTSAASTASTRQRSRA